jgi:hypothetical protein
LSTELKAVSMGISGRGRASRLVEGETKGMVGPDSRGLEVKVKTLNCLSVRWDTVESAITSCSPEGDLCRAGGREEQNW